MVEVVVVVVLSFWDAIFYQRLREWVSRMEVKLSEESWFEFEIELNN
jgi:hypothetical protein